MDKRKKLFIEEANDNDIKIIGGETTKILNLETMTYKWAKKWFNRLFENNWLPEKVEMGPDKLQFKKMTEDEQSAYSAVLSFLIFLDSIQTNNLPNISEYITAPEVKMVLARQTFDEALHSLSYGHIGESVFSHQEFDELVYQWKDGGVLLERIEKITSGYEEFIENPTDDEFLLIAVKNLLLEGLYFYNGFYLFHNLASRGLMVGTQTIIKYIQRDEIVHCNIFTDIIKEVKNENPELFERNKEKIYDLFRDAVDLEIRFSNEVIGSKILGMTEESITEYANHLGNRRLAGIGLDKIFPKSKNPYHHLDLIAGIEDETSNRANNFEVTSITYKNASALEGWDDL